MISQNRRAIGQCLALRQASCPNRLQDKSIFKTKAKEKQKGRHAMAKPGLGYLPKQNPCAQCGKLIAFPDWIEASSGRTSYLWHCRACDYRFEAIAYFEETAIESEPLAA
jgi:hypothetical protein